MKRNRNLQDSEHMLSFRDYVDLIMLDDYESVVNALDQIHGELQTSYFGHDAYENYLKKDISRLKYIDSNGKVAWRNLSKKSSISRLGDGLIVHHVAEMFLGSLSDSRSIWEKQASFDYQTPGWLCYADFAEHAILHALIVKTSDREHKELGFKTTRTELLNSANTKYDYGKDHWKIAASRKMRRNMSPKEIKELVKLIDMLATGASVDDIAEEASDTIEQHDRDDKLYF